METVSLFPLISLLLAQTSLLWAGMPRVDEIGQLPGTPTRLQGFHREEQVAASPNAAELEDVKIPDGTAVHVVLKKSISSEDAKQGEVVELIVAEAVQINGVEVIASGTVARATVVKAKKSAPSGKPGELVMAIQDVVATDGTRIPLRLLKKALPRLGPEAADIAENILIGIAAPFTIYYLPNVDLESPQVQKKKQPGRPATVSAGENFLVFVNGKTTVRAKTSAGNIREGPATISVSNSKQASSGLQCELFL